MQVVLIRPVSTSSLRTRVREAMLRLRARARPLIQASLAAPLAWLLATELLGHDEPIFAPISAMLAIGATVAQPWQRAVETVFGVVIGVGIADLLSLWIGQGTWQIGVIVLLAMGAAIVMAGNPAFVIQAGTAAALVAALPTADGSASMDRVLNTLIGGGCALLFTVVILPLRPLRIVHRAAAPVLEELAQTFEQVGEALRRADTPLAELALIRARRSGDYWARLNEAIGVGRQAARIAPVRRHEEPELLDMAQSVVQLDFAIRDARVLARVALRLTETTVLGGARLELSMREFAAAVRSLDGHLAGEYDETLAVRAAAARAVRLACSIRGGEDDLLFTHLVGQVRSTAVDMMRATGMGRGEAINAMLTAVAEARSA